MPAEVGEVVERIESEHGPPLCALDGEETSSGWGCALKGNEPLDDRQYTYDMCLIRTVELLGKVGIKHVPHIPQSVRASPMVLASLASLGVRELVGSLRRPARCWRRALACKMGINTLAPYWMSLTRQVTRRVSARGRVRLNDDGSLP